MNNSIFYFFYSLSHQTLFLDGLIIFVAVYLPYLVVILAGIYLLIRNKIVINKNLFSQFILKWRELCLPFFSGALAWLLAEGIKEIVASPRPFVIFQNVQNLFPESGFAFPSQHATIFIALAFYIYLENKKAGYFFLLMALLIGIARIAGGVHFPGDILGGVVLGLLCSYILHCLMFAKNNESVYPYT